MIQRLNEIISYTQYSEVLGWILLLISAMFSALFSELLVQQVFRNRKLTILKLVGICIIVFGVFIGITIVLIMILFHFFPQQESLWVLLKKTGKLHIEEFVIPLAITLVIGWIMSGKRKQKKWANAVMCLLLVVSTLLSSVMFFLNSFKMIQRPKYVAPVESIASIMNSRLSLYPFILSGSMLEYMGDGNDLISQSGAQTGENEASIEEQWIEYQEPDNFSGYITAISDGTYALGMGIEDYLSKAYALFLNGEHDNDYFYIGMMWNFIYDCLYLFDDDPSITAEKCLDEAIKAYQIYEEKNGGGAALYSNMAIIYGAMRDLSSEREYTKKALEYGKEESYALSNYLIGAYDRIDNEDCELLMEDAELVLAYEKNLSMYILYGACAIAENKHVENAYYLLCEADEYFKGKSALVKILRCICADLISMNDISALHDIYAMEDKYGLTDTEEAYLIRYLFVANRYEELWGYIVDAGKEEGAEFDIGLVAIKASWYFENPERAYLDIENVKLLLQQIDHALDHVYREEDKDLLLLSQALLRNCLGETEILDMEMNEQDDISDLQYVFLATNAFNEAEYEKAVGYCEAFFEAEKDQKETDSGDVFSLQQLEPQERMTLHYYVQLVFAHAHFEYAKECKKGSDEWKNHMETAEKECIVFEQSSKSLFYIGDKFRILKNSIDMENGKIPENTDEAGMIDIELLPR